MKKILPALVIIALMLPLFTSCGKPETPPVSSSESSSASSVNISLAMSFPAAPFVRSFMEPTAGAITTISDHTADSSSHFTVIVMGVTAADLDAYRAQLTAGGMTANADGTEYSLTDVKLLLEASVASEFDTENYFKISIYPL